MRRSLHETQSADLSMHGHPCAASNLTEATAIAPCSGAVRWQGITEGRRKALWCFASDFFLRWQSPVISPRTMAAAPAPAMNLFGLHQYDGLTSFFGDQNFDYDGFVLPQVCVLYGNTAVSWRN